MGFPTDSLTWQYCFLLTPDCWHEDLSGNFCPFMALHNRKVTLRLKLLTAETSFKCLISEDRVHCRSRGGGVCLGSYYFICAAWTGIKFEGLGGGRLKRRLWKVLSAVAFHGVERQSCSCLTSGILHDFYVLFQKLQWKGTECQWYINPMLNILS